MHDRPATEVQHHKEHEKHSGYMIDTCPQSVHPRILNNTDTTQTKQNFEDPWFLAFEDQELSTPQYE